MLSIPIFDNGDDHFYQCFFIWNWKHTPDASSQSGWIYTEIAGKCAQTQFMVNIFIAGFCAPLRILIFAGCGNVYY